MEGNIGQKCNKPFPSCLVSLFESESWCIAFHMKMSCHSHTEKTHFHKKGFARGLALKRGARQFGNGLLHVRLYDVMHYNPNWCVCMLYPVMLYRNQDVGISHPVTDHSV